MRSAVICSQRLEFGGEVAHQRGLIGDLVAAQRRFLRVDLFQHIDHNIQMALGIDAAGNCQTYQFQFGMDGFSGFWVRMGKHDRADLHDRIPPSRYMARQGIPGNGNWEYARASNRHPNKRRVRREVQ